MKLTHQKLKMMYLAKILMEQTDEEHTITVPEMIAELSKLGISAERKSIYDDLEYLHLFGLDICSNKTITADLAFKSLCGKSRFCLLFRDIFIDKRLDLW